MLYVTTVQHSISFNGSQVGPILPHRGRGPRQGDPLFPYLYIICIEGLNYLLLRVKARGDIHGVSVCQGGSNISHMFFADDNFLFFFSGDRVGGL